MGIPKFVVFDTETTGLFLFKDKATGVPVPADDPRQPRMCSFAAIVCDEDGNELERSKTFIRPEGWRVADYTARSRARGEKAAVDVNGLTDEILQEKGVPVSAVLKTWNEWIDQGLAVAAFNAQFDCKMMRAELRRAGLPDRFHDTRNVCLMKALDPYGAEGLPIMRGFVKLVVASAHFGFPTHDAHDALADAVMAQRILHRLIRDGRLPEPRVYPAAAA